MNQKILKKVHSESKTFLANSIIQITTRVLEGSLKDILFLFKKKEIIP